MSLMTVLSSGWDVDSLLSVSFSWSIKSNPCLDARDTIWCCSWLSFEGDRWTTGKKLNQIMVFFENGGEWHYWFKNGGHVFRQWVIILSLEMWNCFGWILITEFLLHTRNVEVAINYGCLFEGCVTWLFFSLSVMVHLIESCFLECNHVVTS